MKKWSTPKVITVSATDMEKLMVASACPLYSAGCEVIRVVNG